MDVRRMLVFRAVARAGSLGAAARELGWTQPAVSQHIVALERTVGHPLVLRHRRGVTLTAAGQALLERADAIAAQVDLAEREQAQLADLRTGSVRVAAYPSAAATLIPSVLAGLRATAPDLEVRLTQAEPPEAIELMRVGEADLAVVFTHDTSIPVVPDGSDLTSVALSAEPIYLVLPADHPQIDGPEGDVGALSDADWIAGCVRCRTHLVDRCAMAGFAPRIRHSTDDYVVAQNLVAAGLGVTLLPAAALSAFRHPGVGVRPDPRWGTRQVHVVLRDGTERVPGIAAVVALLAGATVLRSRT